MFLNLATYSDKIKYQSIKIKQTTKNAGYSVPYQENMRKIRKEQVTAKQVTL